MCAFDSCDRKAKARGLCGGHYRQLAKGETLKPLRPMRTSPDRPGERFCGTCKLWKDEATEFYNKTASEAKQSECKECMKARTKRTYRRNKGV